MRRVLLITTVVIAGVTSAAGATLPSLGQSKTTTTTFPQSITGIVIRMDAGELQIRPGTPTSVTSMEHWIMTEPTVTETVDNGVLTLQSKCSSTVSVNLSCGVNFTLAVPSDVTVDAVLAAGNIDVAQLTGDEKLTTASGNVTASQITARTLTTHTDSGNVNIEKLRVLETTATTSSGNVVGSQIIGRSLTTHSDSGDVSLEKIRALVIESSSSSGNVTVQGTRAPNSLTAHSDSGNVSVTVPRGFYAIQAHTDSGNVQFHGMKNTSGASRSIVATTSSGNVSVNGA